jgi:hypothetical protein
MTQGLKVTWIILSVLCRQVVRPGGFHVGITPKRLVSSVIKEIMQWAGSQKGGIWQVSQASVVDHLQPQKQSDDRAVLWGSADACPVQVQNVL